jgi:hypothetical protein
MQQTAPAYMSQEKPTSTSVNLTTADGLQYDASDESLTPKDQLKLQNNLRRYEQKCSAGG